MIDQHNSLAEKFLKKGFWLYLFGFIIAPMGYIIKIIISNELSVSDVGILYGIISLVSLISAYNDLGMTESLKHFIPQFVTEKRYDKVKSILFYALFAQIFTSLIIASFFFLGADFIANNYFKTDVAKETLKVFAFFFIAINIFQTINNFFMAIQDTFYHKLTEMIRMFFIMFSVLFVFFGDLSNLQNYSYSWVIGLYIGVIIAIIIFFTKYYKKYFKNEKILFDKQLIVKISKYASIIFLSAGAGTILSQIDMQMIIYILGTTDAGYYTNYLSIIGIPFILIGPIFAFLFPVFSEMHSKKESHKIKKIKELFSNNFIIIGILINIFFFVFAELITYILFGEKFLESGSILKYSVLFLFFNFLLQINFNIMSGIGKINQRVKIVSIAIIFNIIGNYVLINYIGVYGAALASGFGWVLIWILSELYLGKQFIIKYKIINILKNLFGIGILAIISYIYLIPNIIIEDGSRIEYLFNIFAIFVIWLLIFIIINKKDVKVFIGEIKNLRK